VYQAIFKEKEKKDKSSSFKWASSNRVRPVYKFDLILGSSLTCLLVERLKLSWISSRIRTVCKLLIVSHL